MCNPYTMQLCPMTNIVLVLARRGQYVTLKQNVSPRRTCTCDVHSIPYAGRGEAPSNERVATVCTCGRLYSMWGPVNTQIEMKQIRAWEYKFIGQRTSTWTDSSVYLSVRSNVLHPRAPRGGERFRILRPLDLDPQLLL